MREFLTVNNLSYDFIPPYSPALNPIEEFFSALKARYYVTATLTMKGILN